MTPKQTKILSQFFNQFSELANQTSTAFVEAEEKSDQVSIATLPVRNVQPERRLLNKSELADRLGICARTIGELQTEGMPTVKFGKRVLFDYEDILEWAKNRHIKKRRKTNLRVVK